MRSKNKSTDFTDNVDLNEMIENKETFEVDPNYEKEINEDSQLQNPFEEDEELEKWLKELKEDEELEKWLKEDNEYKELLPELEHSANMIEAEKYIEENNPFDRPLARLLVENQIGKQVENQFRFQVGDILQFKQPGSGVSGLQRFLLDSQARKNHVYTHSAVVIGVSQDGLPIISHMLGNDRKKGVQGGNHIQRLDWSAYKYYEFAIQRPPVDLGLAIAKQAGRYSQLATSLMKTSGEYRPIAKKWLPELNKLNDGVRKEKKIIKDAMKNLSSTRSNQIQREAAKQRIATARKNIATIKTNRDNFLVEKGYDPVITSFGPYAKSKNKSQMQPTQYSLLSIIKGILRPRIISRNKAKRKNQLKKLKILQQEQFCSQFAMDCVKRAIVAEGKEKKYAYLYNNTAKITPATMNAMMDSSQLMQRIEVTKENVFAIKNVESHTLLEQIELNPQQKLDIIITLGQALKSQENKTKFGKPTRAAAIYDVIKNVSEKKENELINMKNASNFEDAINEIYQKLLHTTGIQQYQNDTSFKETKKKSSSKYSNRSDFNPIVILNLVQNGSLKPEVAVAKLKTLISNQKTKQPNRENDKRLSK